MIMEQPLKVQTRESIESDLDEILKKLDYYDKMVKQFGIDPSGERWCLTMEAVRLRVRLNNDPIKSTLGDIYPA